MDAEDFSEQETMLIDESPCEDEVEFVGEGPSRPVLDYIDLSCDEDSEGSDQPVRIKDHIDRQKDKVNSTLERLARRVEIKQQQREEEIKAFHEKVYIQRVHGLQELAVIKDSPAARDARHCVNHWLKAPGLKLGVVSASRRPLPECKRASPITKQMICPIMHCKRTFDNGQLLMGHLKRFDHSPCDPTITLHGAPVPLYACVLCAKRFPSRKEYAEHLLEKKKLLDGHECNIPPQIIQCFACPKCFLLFCLRDECLQHMSSANHFMQDEKGIACPVPIPAYAKKVLVALCEEVPFRVFCTSCQSELHSHVALTAHFRTRCRNAGPTSRSEKSIAEVAATFKVKALCPVCRQALRSDKHIEKHAERTKHKVKIIRNMAQSVLAFCLINEGEKTASDFCLSAANARMKACLLKRHIDDDDDDEEKPVVKVVVIPKNKSISSGIQAEKDTNEHFQVTVTAWFCECDQKFSTEQEVGEHIMTANRICHKCTVCGKMADDLSIIRLHMSRFHGGAHLSNFRFWCRTCHVQMHSLEDAMMHVAECHAGHSYYSEKDIVDEEPLPSTSSSTFAVGQSQCIYPPTSSSTTASESAKGRWQCHICEEMFESEEIVKQHCKSPYKHQFHKFCCDLCRKHFHKIETLYRHSQQQHDGDIKMKYFCGLCEDVYFEQEIEFHNHFDSFHSQDYAFVPEEKPSPVKSQEHSTSVFIENKDHMTCGCLQSYTCDKDRLKDSARCLERILKTGNLWYSCSFCSATAKSLEQLKVHLCKDDKEHAKKEFVVKCFLCHQTFAKAVTAQQHYHEEHCFLLKPKIKTDPGILEDIFEFTAKGPSIQEKTVKTPSSYMSVSQDNTRSTGNFGKVEPPTSSALETSATAGAQEMDTVDSELPDLDYLCTMTHIVFLDLDNWASFFTHLPGFLNQGTFVWGFQGGKSNWKPPVNCIMFKSLSNTGSFFLHPRCSNRKDAADFAICLHAGRMDELLPKEIPFTILSGDKGFLELESQFKKTQRPAHILNPHHIDGELMCALLNSISDTFSDPNFEEAIRRCLKSVTKEINNCTEK
ncbi:zinc finger 451 S homeolog isoform X2 [Pelobates cultripes]|nr:zinc finger 451 S homeolog isoform X2 [Pelobates cultripes]